MSLWKKDLALKFQYTMLLAMLTSCASLAEVDRSLVSSPLMSSVDSPFGPKSPHTGIRNSSNSEGTSCSVCAH